MYWEFTNSMKWPSAAMTASILELNLLQALATVSLSKDPIISLILLFRSSFFFEALHWHLTEWRPTQNNPKAFSQASWEAWPPSPTHPFFDVCKFHNLFYALSGVKPGDCYGFRTLLLLHLGLIGAIYFCLLLSTQLVRFCMAKLWEQATFSCFNSALKMFRKYHCHPVFINNR